MPGPIFLRAGGWVGPSTLTDTVTIIGVGATGSVLAMILARMGFTKFVIYDPDDVEPHNLPNQAYDSRHIGKPKVEALSEILKEFNADIDVECRPEYFTNETTIDDFGPVIITTDSMKSRGEIMNVCRDNIMVDYVFETRLGFHHGEVAIIDNNDSEAVDKWLQTLRDDSEIEEGPCNLRTCATLVELIASYTAHQICEKYSTNQTQDNWQYHKRTLVQMNPTLSVYNM